MGRAPEHKVTLDVGTLRDSFQKNAKWNLGGAVATGFELWLGSRLNDGHFFMVAFDIGLVIISAWWAFRYAPKYWRLFFPAAMAIAVVFSDSDEIGKSIRAKKSMPETAIPQKHKRPTLPLVKDEPESIPKSLISSPPPNGIITVGQSGGSNVVNNYAPPNRSISSRQKAAIAESVRPFAGTRMRLLNINGTRESLIFTGNLSDALLSAGLITERGFRDYFGGQFGSQIEFEVNVDDSKQMDLARALAKALVRTGVSIGPIPVNRTRENVMSILVYPL